MSILLDGGLATTLQDRAGLPPFTSPSPWVLDHPERVAAVHAAFVAAGAQAVLTATFRALPHLEPRWATLNPRAVALARASGARVWGSTGPVTAPGRPWSTIDPHDARRWWQAHARALVGADGLVAETLTDPAEALACAEALRAAWPGTLAVCLCPGDDGRLFDGTDPGPVARRLAEAGVDVVGVNCGTGPVGCRRALERMAGVPGPRWLKPNRGTGDWVAELAGADVAYLGGCCGVGPERLARLAATLRRAPSEPGGTGSA